MDSIEVRSTAKYGKKVELTCHCGCGTTFRRYRNKICSGSNYLSRQHQGEHKSRKHLEDQCGRHLPMVIEYLEGAAKERYRCTTAARNLISPFFRYLCQQGIESIQQVMPAMITAFQTWALENGYASASKDISALSTFFQWAIVEGHYEGDSPVIPAIHGRRKNPRSGRPYSDAEMSEIRRLLDERGNERVRAFFEIAAESGMRKSEIERLRVEDVAIDTQTLRVCVPNKTMRERSAFFFDRASDRIREWLTVRKANCGHDFLFHNYYGGPLRCESISNEFKRVLCKTYKGRVVNETGLDSFSIHRLRHTLSSNLANSGADANTLLNCLGWSRAGSVDGYTKLSEQAKVHGFVDAMDRVEKQVDEGFGKEVLTVEEFLLQIEESAAMKCCV